MFCTCCGALGSTCHIPKLGASRCSWCIDNGVQKCFHYPLYTTNLIKKLEEELIIMLSKFPRGRVPAIVCAQFGGLSCLSDAQKLELDLVGNKAQQAATLVVKLQGSFSAMDADMGKKWHVDFAVATSMTIDRSQLTELSLIHI